MRKANNFDALRLLAALLVAVAHASSTLVGFDWLSRATSVQSFNAIGLNIFCVISGYLITQSRTRNTAADFARARALRILPGLFVALILMGFVLGPLVTKLSLRTYFTSFETWRFFTSSLILPLNTSLPGVFNGVGLADQLYSLTPELVFYIFIGIAGCWKRVFPLVSTLLIGVWSVLILNNYTSLPFTRIFHPHIHSWNLMFFPVRLGTLCVFYLLMGSVLAKLNLDNRLLSRLTPGLLVLWIVALKADRHSYDMVEMMLLPLIVIGIGNMSAFHIRIPRLFGDVSYGTYVYHNVFIELALFQAGLIWRSWFGVFVVVCLSLGCGWLSFHLVEKRALALKSRRSLQATAAVSIAADSAADVAAHSS